MKVKAKDIAKAAGVSTTAVSLVLNGKDSRISEATKEKILRISREMAFQSEITVQPGGSQRVKTLGLVLPDLKDPVFYKLLIYIQEYAFQKGYMVFFCACGDDAERCCTIVEGLVVKNVDGLAVVAPSTLEKDDSLTKTLHTIQDNGVPLVLLDRAVYSIFSDFVTTDNKYGGRAAAEKLVQAGAKQIGCILGPAQVYTTKYKMKRYAQMKKIIEFFNSPKISRMGEYMLTGRYIMVLFALASVFVIFDISVAGVLTFACITGITLVLCEDLLAPFPPFLFLCLIGTKCYNSFSVFIQYKALGAVLIICVIMHFVLHWKKPVLKGFLTLPMIFVSAAVMLGGVGFISKREYFSGASIFYILALGVGMLLLYTVFNTHINVHKDYSLMDKLSLIMVIIGCFGTFMVASYYLTHINEVIDTKTILYFQWRNNCSTFLMLSIPFAFYRGNKKSYSIMFGFLFYFAILLTGSRGGLVFGAIELMMCCILFFLYDRERRFAYIAILACICFALMIFSREFLSFFGYTFDRLMSAINGVLVGEQKEVRVFQYERGIKDFLGHPIFGTGIGYMGNIDIYDPADFSICWYHCEPIQIAASMGIVGILAYVYQFIKRMFLLWRKPTLFNMTVFLSYVSLELMSLVNPGIFCPIPYLLIVTIFFVVVEKSTYGEYQPKIYVMPSSQKDDTPDGDDDDDEVTDTVKV